MSYVFFKYFAHYDTVIQMAMQIEVDCFSAGTTASGQCQRAAYRSVREVAYEAMSKLIPCDQIDRQNT
jgi:hypothetical protein